MTDALLHCFAYGFNNASYDNLAPCSFGSIFSPGILIGTLRRVIISIYRHPVMFVFVFVFVYVCY
jgi:hypothetical protein